MSYCKLIFRLKSDYSFVWSLIKKLVHNVSLSTYFSDSYGEHHSADAYVHRLLFSFTSTSILPKMGETLK